MTLSSELSASPSVHSSFSVIRSQYIPSLNITVEEYEHQKTGAVHIHLSADNSENVFLVALRTVPEDSTGVAHILEHTALCGSQHYPVRDPFFMMTRRSLNTFMNAFTSSDWTAYPFASLNRKDFDNLLSVYLDAVFFSRLDPLDFAQEGHRLEFSEPSNPNSALEYKGVVYNEMKGAMSSVPSQLWHTLGKYLFPTTTYHYNSGGDPESIPDLSYEELLEFYKTHYHPSNAIFMTYGDIPAVELQAKFEDRALQHFSRLEQSIRVGNEKRYHSPIRIEESYPFNDGGDSSSKTHVVIGWLLGLNTDLRQSFRAQLLASALLDNSASPLMHALETSDLGAAPSPLCGLDDSQKEAVFVCGLEGCADNIADQVENLIFATIEQVADTGIPFEQLNAVLHQLELHQREVGGDSYPYGLQLILNALTAATHDGDPVALLDIDTMLDELRNDIKDPEFIKNLAREYLLDNQHRVRLVLKPDQDLNARREQALASQLEIIKASLAEEEKTSLVTLAKQLEDRQNQKEDESILPKVDLADIPKDIPYINGTKGRLNQYKYTQYQAGTNGIVYQQILIDLPVIHGELQQVLPLYSAFLTELGIGKSSYLDIQKRQAQICGAIGAYSSVHAPANNTQDVLGHFTLSAKALNRNQAALSQLMWETLTQPRFDELSRIRELVAQTRARREQSITGNGHVLAMSAASSGICATAKLSHELSGLAGITSLKKLDDSLDNQDQLEQFSARFIKIQESLQDAPHQFLLVSEAEQQTVFEQNLERYWQPLQHKSENYQAFSLNPVNEKISAAWLTNSQVNFCAKAYATVPLAHEDSASLSVLGHFLRNGFLHRAIREQGGAYGGGASQDNHIGAFRFYSYRDPRIEGTLNDFDQAIAWLVENKHNEQALEEAILGVISAMDKPASPAGDAKKTFHAELYGRNQLVLQGYRERVLNTTLSDLVRVAETYLDSSRAHIAVITDLSNENGMRDKGLDIKRL